MKTIDFLVLHSTNTSEAKPLTKYDIIAEHIKDKRIGGKGWNRPGFDSIVLQDGQLQSILASSTKVDLWGVTSGKYPISGRIEHIAYVGGRTLKSKWTKDSRTDSQKQTLEAIAKYYVLKYPDIVIAGYNQVLGLDSEENPAFDVATWLEEIGIPSKNIFKTK